MALKSWCLKSFPNRDKEKQGKKGFRSFPFPCPPRREYFHPTAVPGCPGPTCVCVSAGTPGMDRLGGAVPGLGSFSFLLQQLAGPGEVGPRLCLSPQKCFLGGVGLARYCAPARGGRLGFPAGNSSPGLINRGFPAHRYTSIYICAYIHGQNMYTQIHCAYINVCACAHMNTHVKYTSMCMFL